MCGAEHPASERFCASCGVPLIEAGSATRAKDDVRAQTARQIDPRYVAGEPVRVAGASSAVEAQFIQNLLLAEGIPSLLRTVGGQKSQIFPAGSAEILVPAAAVDAARDVLLQRRDPPLD